jgi:RNA recognition motif-containing protein
MDSITTLTGILSGGVAGAVISALWNHLSKLSLQRNQANSAEKLAKVEHSLESLQRKDQAEIDRSVFVTRAHFETEFEAMKDIFSSLSEVRVAMNGVRPMLAIEPADEAKEERLKRLWERLKALMIATDKLLNTSESKAPFYSEELYGSVNGCWKWAVMEINSIREAVPDSLNPTEYLRSQNYKDKFSEGYFESVRIIRNRIAKEPLHKSATRVIFE